MSDDDAQEKARAHLLNAIDMCRRTGKRRLPSIRVLAAQSQLSPSIIWRTITRLRNEGVLESRRGAWVDVANVKKRAGTVPGTDAGGPKLKWERLCARIAHEIFLGYHQPDSVLPGPKVMIAQYGVSYSTMRKALDQLVQRGTLIPYKRGFRVPSSEGRHNNGLIALIARGDARGDLVSVGLRTRELFHLLEGECARTRIAIEFLPYDYANGRLYATRQARTLLAGDCSRMPLLGVMIWSSTVQDPDNQTPDNLFSLVQRILPLRVPVVMLSESGEREEDVIAMAGSRMTTISISHSPSAGRIAGERLLSLGHRHVAYISVNHETAWSRNRLAGLVRAFSDAGENGVVRTFVREDITSMQRTNALRTEFTDGFAQLRAACRASGAGILPKLAALIDKSQNALGMDLHRELSHEAMRPLFERAAALPDVTAWVAANDDAAFACLDFLESIGKQVPKDISVVGFDDTPEAGARRVSSYNFDCAGAIHAALRYVLEPRERSARARNPVCIDIEGYIVERRTTAKAALYYSELKRR